MIVKIIRDLNGLTEDEMNEVLGPSITEKDRTDFFNGPIYDELQREYDQYTMLFISSDEKGPWDDPNFENDLNQALNEGDMLGFAAVLDDAAATATLALSPTPSTAQTALVFNKGKGQKDPILRMSEDSLDPEMKEAYQQIDNHYDYLAELITTRNQKPFTFFSGNPFAKRFDHIIPALEFLVQGAREEKNALKIETLEKMQEMLMSLRALSAHQSHYSEDHFEKRWDEFEQLLEKQNVTKETQQKLKAGLKGVVASDLFKEEDRKKFTEFDLAKTIDLKSIPSEANVKIAYDSESSLLKVQFSYHRARLLSIKNTRFSGSAQTELEKFCSQISDVVTVALSECKKGSKDNPIHIEYRDPERPQPEAALGVLMEVKKRAILEGKTFHATDHNGKAIEITPEIALSQEEKDYFMHFANQTPSIKNAEGEVKEGKHTIGYQLLKLSDPDLKKRANEDQILKSMEKTINHQVRDARSERDQRINGFVSEQQQEAKASTRPSKM